MSVSCAGAEAHGNGSARMRAGARWNACGNESGAGGRDTLYTTISVEGSHRHVSPECRGRPRDELDILI
jgi:hypothetical protein